MLPRSLSLDELDGLTANGILRENVKRTMLAHKWDVNYVAQDVRMDPVDLANWLDGGVTWIKTRIKMMNWLDKRKEFLVGDVVQLRPGSAAVSAPARPVAPVSAVPEPALISDWVPSGFRMVRAEAMTLVINTDDRRMAFSVELLKDMGDVRYVQIAIKGPESDELLIAPCDKDDDEAIYISTRREIARNIVRDMNLKSGSYLVKPVRGGKKMYYAAKWVAPMRQGVRRVPKPR